MGRVIRAGEPPRHVLAAEVLDARQRAEHILAEARSEADRIVSEARAEADRIRREATEAGLREGQARAATLVTRASEIRDRMLTDAEGQVTKLALAVARRLVGAAAASDPSLVRGLVEQALARTRRARTLELRVHPDDAPQVRELVDGRPREISVEADASIERGGCVLHTDVGDVDARLEVQLAAIERALSTET
ncbi:MAG: type III secretion system stator protein SctL [Myxococcota bacterium]